MFSLNFDVLHQNNIMQKQNAHFFEIIVKTVRFRGFTPLMSYRAYSQSICPERMSQWFLV